MHFEKTPRDHSEFVEGGESSPSRPATKVLSTRTEELRRVRATGCPLRCRKTYEFSTAPKSSLMEATCSHPVAEVTVFSKQRARRRRRTSGRGTSTRQACGWAKTLAPCSLRVVVPSNTANLVVELR